jgi:hypothetical protein
LAPDLIWIIRRREKSFDPAWSWSTYHPACGCSYYTNYIIPASASL